MGSKLETIDIVADRYHLAGGILSGVFWGKYFSCKPQLALISCLGIHVIFFWCCVNSIIKKPSVSFIRKWLLLGFACFMFVAGTLNFIGTWAITQEDFVDNRLFPGGPTVYNGSHFGRPEAKMRSIVYIVANMLSEGTMVCPWHLSVKSLF
jgi:hypothetical protein